MRITGREFLFSVVIVSLWVGLGIIVSRPILASLTKKALKTVEAHQVSDSLKFSYLKRTDAGDFLAESTLEAINPVSIKDIPGEFLEIRKETEKYTYHVQTYTTTDGKGHTTVHTRTYYSWDSQGTPSKWVVDSVSFLGAGFKLSEVGGFSHRPQSDTTIYENSRVFHLAGDIRYCYYTYPRSTKGVMRGRCEDKEYKDLMFTSGGQIERIIKRAERNIKSVPWIFWALWILFLGFGVFGFYYIENDWLED